MHIKYKLEQDSKKLGGRRENPTNEVISYNNYKKIKLKDKNLKILKGKHCHPTRAQF